MKISFVIPAFNEEAYVGSCLSALTTAIAKDQNGIESEVIVVDNTSTDGTQNVVQKFPHVRLVYEARKGLPYARQRGFQESTGDIVVCFDADTRITPGWITKMLRLFSKNNRIVAVSGPYNYYDLPVAWRKIAHSYRIVAGNVGHALTGRMVAGGNMAIRRSALSQIGGFNTGIKFYGEDLDTATRLQKIGRIFYTDQLAIDASARRFQGQGVLRTTAIYTLNFLSINILNHPVHAEFRDFR